MDLERVVLLAGVLLTVFVSMFRRRLGGVIGLFLSAGILWWGLAVYGKGGAIGFAGKPLPRGAFLVFVAVFFLYNGFSIWRGDPKDGE